jgi:hypothetical protein
VTTTARAQTQTWAYGIGPRVLLVLVALFMYGVAAFLALVPLMVGRSETGLDVFLILCGLVVAGLATFMLFGFLAFMKAKISLDATALHATIVAGHNRLLVPRFEDVVVPIDEIASVERRTEVLRSFGLSSLRESLSIVTTAGRRIGLCSKINTAVGSLPFDEIAATLASATGKDVIDRGTVMVKGGGIYGETPSTWNEPALDPASAAKARKTAALTMQILVGMVMFIFVLRACTHQ